MADRVLAISASYEPRRYQPGRPLDHSERPSIEVPFIRLRGRWLEAAGFEVGATVRVEVARGRLVITLATRKEATA